MAYTTIDDPSAYFQIALYAGNGTGQTITNDGNSDLKPDFLWFKNRSETVAHTLWDSNRGITKFLVSNDTAGEYTNASGYELTSFNTDGFGLGGHNNAGINQSASYNYVAWQWKVNGGTTTSLSSNINSVCQVNQDAGISIVKYTCTGGGNGQAVQHGLGLVPQVIVTKNRTDTSYSDWITYHHSIGYTNFLKLNTTGAQAGSSPYNGGEPTNLTYNVSIDLVEATKDYVSYVFAPIQGYSHFGSYLGNQNALGPMVYTGFKPAFVMVKCATAAGSEWQIYDNKRPGYNFPNYNLSPNNNTAEYTGESYHNMDLLSNGFRPLLTDVAVNKSKQTYIYMAFAENPFVTSTGIPTTAR